MNKFLKICLILSVLNCSFALQSEYKEEQGVLDKIIEMAAVAANPTFENGKFNPFEKQSNTFLQMSENKASNIDTTTNAPGLQSTVFEKDHVELSGGNLFQENMNQNSTDSKTKNENKKLATSTEAENIQEDTNLLTVNSHKKSTRKNNSILKRAFLKPKNVEGDFDKENHSTFMQTSTRTKDDPQPAPAPQGGTIEDSKTAASIDSLKSDIKDDVDKATEQMKDDMKKNNEEMKEQLKAATDNLKDEIVESQKNITAVVKNESRKVTDEIKKSEKELKKEVNTVELKVDDNLVQTIKLRIMALEEQLDNKKAQYADVQLQADQLRATLPPPKTICDTFFDCSACTENPKCGWCIAEQKCVEGDKIGPLHMSCNFYDYGVCSGGGCSRYKDCDSCVGDPLCGFCAENEKCLERPADFNGCKPTLWYHSQGNQPLCPLPDVVSADPLKEVQPNKLVEDGVQANEQPTLNSEPDSEKELIRKKQDQLLKLDSLANKLKAEIDGIKKDLNEARAERDKYEKILAENMEKMQNQEEEEQKEEEEEENQLEENNEEEKENEEEDDNEQEQANS